jgi:HEPN domain-containing protein
MNDKAKYWIELAEYDLETAEAMFKTNRLLYVGFMCHQVIEKALKALITNIGATPPFIHNLSKLALLSNILDELDEDKADFLDLLDPLNIQARYPEQKEKVMASLNTRNCMEILDKTKELFEWIKAML